MQTRVFFYAAALVVAAAACSDSNSHDLNGSPPAAARTDDRRRNASPPGLPGAAAEDQAAEPTPSNSASRPSLAGTGAANFGAGGRGGGGGSGGTGPAPQVAPPVSTNTEKFTDVGTNPFIIADHDPFSTFAADVDTASYDIFRRNVEHNIATQPTSIRLEEFVNYFEYDYPKPADDNEHPFAISAATAQNPLGRDTVLLRVGIQAKDPIAATKRPANLVFLVDVSGSMQTEDKLPLVQYLLTQTLEVLDADDKVSIVTYAGNTAVRLAPTSVVQKAEIAAVISSLTAGGSTNGEGGIQLAYQQAERALIQDGINHVILCTDGDFNVGVSNTDALVEMIKEKRKSGITLTALGFGLGNLNDAMMEKVSNAGNGMYSVITSRTQASRYAEDRMLRTFVHVAKDLKIQVEWNPEYVSAYRLLGYEDRAIADKDFRNDAVDAGEVGAGHRVTALYEVVAAGKQIPQLDRAPAPRDGDPVEGAREIGKDGWVLVKVRYKQPGASESDPAREVLTRVLASEIPKVFGEADRDLQYSAAIAAFAEILKKSPYATPNKLDVLRQVFMSQADRDNERKEFMALFEKAVTLLQAGP